MVIFVLNLWVSSASIYIIPQPGSTASLQSMNVIAITCVHHFIPNRDELLQAIHPRRPSLVNMLFPPPLSINIPNEITLHQEVIPDSEEERVFDRTADLQSHPSPVKRQHKSGAREVIYISSDEDESEHVHIFSPRYGVDLTVDLQ